MTIRIVEEKVDAVRLALREYASVAVAYSGGADSAFLADIAHEVLGEKAIAVCAVSESLAPIERADASALATERGWRYAEVRTDELSKPEYRKNDADRCFHCKDTLFDALEPLAQEFGVAHVLVGTNADDLGDYRPGLRAAAEHEVHAPLADAGMTKAEVREASRARGLRTWDKPASPCLSSRIAYGVEVTPERLDRVARAEAFLRQQGFREFRVRDHGDLARIEVPAAEIARLAGEAVRIADHLKHLGFSYVTLDLEGFRSGSMNVPLGTPVRRKT